MFDLLTTKQAFLDAQGNPASNHRLWTKVSGSNTNKSTFKDADGAVANTNPIILDTRGEVPFGVYGTTGTYRLILTTPGDTTDPPTSPIWTRDGVSGINDFVAASITEWQPTGLTPTFLTSTAFSVPGDQTALFHPARRVRATVGAGFRYGTIQSSTFNAGPVTTSVILVNDSASGLDASLSALAVGNISALNTSQPQDATRGLDIAAAGTVTFPANADRFNLTGSVAINAFANSWTGRRVYLTHSAVQALTHSATFVLPGAVGFSTAAGDESVWEQTNSTPTWKLINYNAASALRSVLTLKKEVSTISVVNTTTTTDIANVSIPGGALGVDGIATWRVFGNILQNSGVNNSLVFFVLFGGAVIWQDVATISTGGIRRAFILEFSVAAKNSATVQSGSGRIAISQPTAPTFGLGSISQGNNPIDVVIATNNTDLAVNTAIAQMFEFSVQWGTASTQSEVVRKFAVCTLG